MFILGGMNQFTILKMLPVKFANSFLHVGLVAHRVGQAATDHSVTWFSIKKQNTVELNWLKLLVINLGWWAYQLIDLVKYFVTMNPLWKIPVHLNLLQMET